MGVVWEVGPEKHTTKGTSLPRTPYPDQLPDRRQHTRNPATRSAASALDGQVNRACSSTLGDRARSLARAVPFQADSGLPIRSESRAATSAGSAFTPTVGSVPHGGMA